MATRSRAVDLGEARGRAAVAKVVSDARIARVGAGLAQGEVARAIRVSASQYSRIERGLSPDLSIRKASRLCAVLGLDLSVRTFPAGDPIRDAVQIALLERLRARCHSSLTWRTEVPMELAGDRRAWDATISADSWRAGVEAETALTDLQALDRKLALKERDGGMDRVVLVLLDSRRNRSALRVAGDILRRRFPIDPAVALARLALGIDPGGNAMLLL
jgi:transcriptional regulator with XRE-family HTH domain